MGYSTDIKLDLMVTGSNSGTWGTKTNTNLQLIEEALCGYIDQDVAGGAGTTALVIADAASTGKNCRNMIIKLSGTITGNRIVTVPTTLEKMWIFSNETSGAYTVQLKGASDGGAGYIFSTTNKGKRILYMTGTNMVDAGFPDDSYLTLGGNLDVGSSSIVSLSNGNIPLAPNGTGEVLIGSGSADGDITSSGAYDLILDTNSGTNASKITLTNGANGNITFTNNGTGKVKFEDAAYNPEETLTDEATISWDAQAKPIAKVTLTDNRTLAAPTNGIAGQFISLLIIQDAGGTNTLVWNGVFEFPVALTPPVLTSTGDLADLFVFRYHNSKWLQVGSTLALTV